MQDPEQYLINQNISLACAVHGDRPAVIDAAHRSMLNFEIFYFSDEPSKAQFEAEPLRYCGIVTDPVSHARFLPGSGSPRIDWNGRPYYFLSEETLTQFKTMPDSFAQPNYTMRTIESAPDSSDAGSSAPQTAAPQG